MLDPLRSETAGTDLFEGPAPALPVNIVVLTQYGGEAAKDRVFGPSLTPPGVEVSRIQLMVRHTEMATAKTTADAYHALLDGYFGTIGSRTYHFVRGVDGMPHSIGQDARGNWRWVSNYSVEHER